VTVHLFSGGEQHSPPPDASTQRFACSNRHNVLQRDGAMRIQISNMSVLFSLVLLLSPLSVPAQQTSMDDLKKEVETLSQNMNAMQKDLQEIKAMLQNRVRVAPPQNVVLDLGKRPVKGDRGAKLTLVEFLDYQCPYCGKFSRETMPQIEKDYIETGKVRYVVVNLPLDAMHKSAFKAAEAAACAGEQGKFWEMQERLFNNQQIIDQWQTHAEAIGLDGGKFQECLDSGRQAAKVRSDIAEAHSAGVTGTPSFFLAYTDPKSTTVKTLTELVGSQAYASFKTAIDKQLVDTPIAMAEKK
jgi:protein-disulfide isomerase